jgi:hypothetical protein
MFVERGRDFDFNTKEHYSNAYKNPQRPGHTNEQNYRRVVVYSALQKRYFLPDFSVIAEKVLEGWRRLLVSYLTKIHIKNVGTFQLKVQVKQNITRYVVLYNFPRNM